MKYILKTGFSSIHFDISFDETKLKNGKNLSVDGHVLELTEVKESGVEHFIKARVVRTASVGERPYQVKLHLDEERRVHKTECDCQSRQSGKCKHLYAVIYTINNHESSSKTTYSQSWGQISASTLGKEKYSKGRFFHEMFKTDPLEKVEPYEVTVEELNEPSALRQMLIECRKPKMDHEINHILNTMIERVFITAQELDCEGCLTHIFNLNKEHPIYSEQIILSKEIQDFYNEQIVMSQNKIIKVCCETVSQSNSKQWFSIRFSRISASKNVHRVKSRVKKSIDSLVNDMLHPKNISNKDIKYGINNEKQARREYINLFACEVIEVGVIVNDSQPWLCASLDGLVVKNNSLMKIVEIKCPPVCKDVPVVDYKKKTCAVNYLHFVNERVELKKSDIYFTQCQTQLYVTGLTECDLFIYSQVKDGSCCVTIYRDESFLKEVILKCHRFYYTHFLPALFKFITLKNNNVSTEMDLTEMDSTEFF